MKCMVFSFDDHIIYGGKVQNAVNLTVCNKPLIHCRSGVFVRAYPEAEFLVGRIEVHGKRPIIKRENKNIFSGYYFFLAEHVIKPAFADYTLIFLLLCSFLY